MQVDIAASTDVRLYWRSKGSHEVPSGLTASYSAAGCIDSEIYSGKAPQENSWRSFGELTRSSSWSRALSAA